MHEGTRVVATCAVTGTTNVFLPYYVRGSLRSPSLFEIAEMYGTSGDIFPWKSAYVPWERIFRAIQDRISFSCTSK